MIGVGIGIPFKSKIRRTLISDGFNRADATALGSADSGGVWEPVLGSFEIKAGKLYARAAGANMAKIDTSTTKYRVSANISDDSVFGLVFRVVDSGNYYSCRLVTGVLELYKFVSTAATLIGSAPRAVSGVRSLMIEVDDTNIKCYVNGVLLLALTDSSLGTPTKAGLRCFDDSTTVYLDDFIVEEL